MNSPTPRIDVLEREVLALIEAPQFSIETAKVLRERLKERASRANQKNRLDICYRALSARRLIFNHVLLRYEGTVHHPAMQLLIL